MINHDFGHGWPLAAAGTLKEGSRMPKPDDWSMQAERAAKMQQADLAIRELLRKAREQERRGLLQRADRERELKARPVRS